MIYTRQKYARHQNGREQMRRLKQIARGQNAGATLEALETAARVHLILNVAAAEAACAEYLDELTYWHAEGPEYDRGRAYLLGAVKELGRYVRGEPEIDSFTTSTLLRDLPAPPAASGDGDHDLALG